MALSQVKGKMNYLVFFCVSLYYISYYVAATNVEYLIHNRKASDYVNYNELSLLKHQRQRRDLSPTAQTGPHGVSNKTPVTSPDIPKANTTNTVSQNKTVPTSTTQPTAAKTQTSAISVTTPIPLLGKNGTGIRKDITPNPHKVSDPIPPYDDLNATSLLNETPEMIKAEHNVTNLKYDNHTFYNSSFIGDVKYFDSYWANITAPKADIHSILSNSHRRATTLKLKFDFPFYGHSLKSITVATGGFIYTGDHVHNWLAATQYIAPLMSNFDTTLTNNSWVKLSDDGTKFTALWENVTLQEDKDKPFTFAVTLFKNGDIVFAYKTIPISLGKIQDDVHPVKVGISDAYLTDKIMFYVRRKTIYEYHRISFMDHEITNKTILRLTALPTCLQYTTCEDCANHQTSFNCSWCSATKRCSSGTDRYKQDWLLRNCDKNSITNATNCPKPTPPTKATAATTNQTDVTKYFTDYKSNPYHDAVIRTEDTVSRKVAPTASGPSSRHMDTPAAAVSASATETSRSPIGGVMAAFVVIVLISSLAAWILYAFKNPHTRSGQFIIKYRPSQWSWKRGEARYTAATIHM